MGNWFEINLGDAMLAHDLQDRVEQAFMSAYALADCPQEMAAFIRHESEGQLHCELKVYLSPESVSVAREFNAAPCERPSPGGLSILIGSPESWLILFPDSNP